MLRRLAAPVLSAALLTAACGGATTVSQPEAPQTTAIAVSPTTSAPTGTTGTIPAAPTDPAPGFEARPARLVAVIDGDSVELEVNGRTLEVRLEAVNTPEGGECWGDRARDTTRDLLAGADLTIEAGDTDQYGRTLGYLWAGDTMVNLELLRRGAAIAIVVDHRYLREFLATEEAAFSSGAGLWSADACGPPTAARVAIRFVEFDPPGRDDEVPNDEYVVIVNDGGTVDLGGWTLRDESSTHRYAFPGGLVLGDGETLAVHSGCGDDGGGHLYWCAGDAVWSNGGDTALLLDPNGGVVDRYRYQGYLG